MSSDQVVILAGGLATRMRPRTERLPKLLLPVAGRPFAEWLLERLASCGFENALLCIGHLGDRIRGALGDGRAFGIRVTYSDEGPHRMGTAGALRHALEWLEPTFVVTYGDSYLPFDYKAPLMDLRAHPESSGTMAVFENKSSLEPSNCRVRGDRVLEYQKAGPGSSKVAGFDWIDYGAMALRKEVIASLPADAPTDLGAVQRGLSISGTLRAHRAANRFFEIGSERGLADLEKELAK